MRLGIGLPTIIQDVDGHQITEWARRAEAAGFSSVGTMDGIVFPNYEPLVALGAAAAVTERIELVTAIAILPYRQNAALVAKQAATLHRLSRGRLVFGVAIGGTPGDYEISGVRWEGRGERLVEMIEEIKRVWAGADRDGIGAVGPDVSGDPPPILVGGAAAVAFRRAARYGDGWIMAGGSPEAFRAGRETLVAAFRDAGRRDRPRAMASAFFSLGEDPEGQARRTLGKYFAFDPPLADAVVADTLKSEEAIREHLRAFEEQGCDSFLLFPASSDPDQVDLLARAVFGETPPARWQAGAQTRDFPWRDAEPRRGTLTAHTSSPSGSERRSS
jgi:alkanesulfonate monooxygenase SsuD/methylene tetrahydromethanopterin reductase-like flavin-dependent oxidoreductase (luciferase family)